MTDRKAVLVTSFGTSFEETRKKTIEAIENDIRSAFPDRLFVRAWTSGRIRKKLRERDGLEILSVSEALEMLAGEGIADVCIQPTLILSGGEYEKIEEAAARVSGKFEKITVGRPLLDTEEDIRRMADLLIEMFRKEAGEGMMVFMGHGSETAEFNVYDRLNEAFEAAGHPEFCTGTVEFDPGIAPVMERIEKLSPEKVSLTPLLIVAGDHALNDMAGGEEDSWKNRIAGKGPEVHCIVKGLGEYEKIRNLFVKKAKEAI